VKIQEKCPHSYTSNNIKKSYNIMVKIGKLSGVSFRKEDSSSATKP